MIYSKNSIQWRKEVSRKSLFSNHGNIKSLYFPFFAKPKLWNPDFECGLVLPSLKPLFILLQDFLLNLSVRIVCSALLESGVNNDALGQREKMQSFSKKTIWWRYVMIYKIKRNASVVVRRFMAKFW